MDTDYFQNSMWRKCNLSDNHTVHHSLHCASLRDTWSPSAHLSSGGFFLGTMNPELTT